MSNPSLIPSLFTSSWTQPLIKPKGIQGEGFVQIASSPACSVIKTLKKLAVVRPVGE